MSGEGKGDGNGYIGIYKTIMSRIKLSSLYIRQEREEKEGNGLAFHLYYSITYELWKLTWKISEDLMDQLISVRL